jgi:hypothetical protein
MEAGGWSLVVAEEPRIETTTEELREELAYLLEDDGVGSARVLAERQSGPALVEELARMGPEDVALLPLPLETIVSVSRSLDYWRGRLVGHPRGVIVTSEASVQVLAAEAPNFWSWVGPRVWNLDPGAGRLDLDLAVGRLDPEARLASLRQGMALSEAEMLRRAEAGTLEPDPVYAEWLVLLGRGDLLAH